MSSNSFFPPPVRLLLSPEGESFGGGKLSRRSFIKRTGGATAATFITWNSLNLRARAEEVQACTHSDHGNHDNGDISPTVQEKAEEWLNAPATGSPPENFWQQAARESLEKTAQKLLGNGSSGQIDVTDFLSKWAENLGKNLYEKSSLPSKQQALDHFSENRLTYGTASVPFAFGALAAIDDYVQKPGTQVSARVKLSSILSDEWMHHDWECGEGKLSVGWDAWLKATWKDDLLHPEVEQGAYFQLGWSW